MISLFYILATLSLATGTAAIYMSLIQPFPVQWLYYHYFIRKPIVWTILVCSLGWAILKTMQSGTFPFGTLIPLILMVFAVILAYKMHQENAFKAVDFPPMAADVFSLPLSDEMEMAIVEYDGVSKAYPLGYVIHHHVVNDQFGEKIVALTYCAMCRSIIPFDVTDIGPLFVGSFKNANMIVADRRTKTFFQQSTFESIIGKLHPHTLTMIPFQTLSWGELKQLSPIPAVVTVTERDFRQFQLPIPGVWKKIIASKATPGLTAKNRDATFPARTHVVGVIDPIASPQVVYLKEEIMKQGLVINRELNIALIASDYTVLGFKLLLDGHSLELGLTSDKTLSDASSETTWDIRGKYIKGKIASDLNPIAISDEYWFSWKNFHPESQLIRV